jgi:hypothetical protein
MVNAPQFETLDQIDASPWLDSTKSIMNQDQWPDECVRCKDTEQVGNKSIRQYFLDDHKTNLSINEKYLVLGGVLDNICNSACQTCNENLSTKIGSLTSKNYIKINNSGKVDQLPTDRIVKIDINGGEPSASPNYQKFVDQYGSKVVELDAAPVKLLQSKLREAIESVIDVVEFNAQAELEAQDAATVEAHRQVVFEAIKGAV